MSKSKELFSSIREAMLEEQLKSLEYENHQLLADLRNFNLTSGTTTPKQNKSGLESLKIKNNK